MKKVASFLFILVATVALATAQTPNEIFTKFYDATGGKAKWEAVKTYTLNRSFVANAPTDYDMEVNVDAAQNSISRRKSIMKRDFFYVSRGNSGWVKIPMGSMDRNVRYTVKDLTAQEVEDMQREVKDGLLAFVNYGAKGFTATYEGQENVNGKVADKVKLTRDDLTITYYFDRTTNLLVKEEYTTDTMSETWEHTAYDTTKNGLKYASSSTYINAKDKKKVNVTTKLVIDEPINASLFVK